LRDAMPTRSRPDHSGAPMADQRPPAVRHRPSRRRGGGARIDL